jgi:membrane associated rhomboid family serine protease
MTPWVRRLLVANVIVFFLTMMFPYLRYALAFIPLGIVRQPWTAWSVVTYMFVHADIWHILFNMLILFFFGPRLEVRLGSGKFLALYLVSGLTAAAVSATFSPSAAIIGASGAVFGVQLAYARYWPRDLIYIWGVLPVEARWLVIVLAAISLYAGFSGAMSGIAHFAHLGGFAGGWAYLKWIESRSPARRWKKQVQPPEEKPRNADLARWRGIDRSAVHPVNREELDRLMTKIEERGVGSLTPDERALLDRFV